MTRRNAWVGLAAGAAMVAGCASASARPPTFPAASACPALEFYPLLPGWGWAYQVERDGTTVLSVYSVGDWRADRATVQHGDERLDYALLADGIARRTGDVAGDYVIKLPLDKGGSWPVADGTATLVEVGKTVTLPAGTFDDCAIVVEVRRDPPRTTRTTFCRGAGPVELEMRVFSPSKQAYEVHARARIMNVSRPEAATPE